MPSFFNAKDMFANFMFFLFKVIKDPIFSIPRLKLDKQRTTKAIII